MHGGLFVFVGKNKCNERCTTRRIKFENNTPGAKVPTCKNIFFCSKILPLVPTCFTQQGIYYEVLRMYVVRTRENRSYDTPIKVLVRGKTIQHEVKIERQ